MGLVVLALGFVMERQILKYLQALKIFWCIVLQHLMYFKNLLQQAFKKKESQMWKKDWIKIAFSCSCWRKKKYGKTDEQSFRRSEISPRHFRTTF